MKAADVLPVKRWFNDATLSDDSPEITAEYLRLGIPGWPSANNAIPMAPGIGPEDQRFLSVVDPPSREGDPLEPAPYREWSDSDLHVEGARKDYRNQRIEQQRAEMPLLSAAPSRERTKFLGKNHILTEPHLAPGSVVSVQDSRKLLRREPLKHDRLPQPRLRNLGMTVCAASVFYWVYSQDPLDLGLAIVAASDRKLSDTGLGIGYQGSKWKGAAFPDLKQLVLISGDIVIHTSVLKELEDRIKGGSFTTKQTAESVSELIRDYKMNEGVRLFLSPLGLNGKTFLAQQRTMEPSLVAELTRGLIEYTIDAEAIVAGIDGPKDARIYRVDSNGLVTDHSGIGFVSYPYPARAGCATVAGSRRTRLAPPGMVPVLS
jgi:hypothetical protein